MWVVKLDAVVVDDVSVTSMCTKQAACVALVDTGTSFIGVPARQWSRLFKLLTSQRSDCKVNSESKEIVCSASGFDGLPVLAFRLKGRDFTLTPEDYMIGSTMGLMELPANSGQIDLFILGDTFIKSYYTVFDMESNQVGIANPKDTPGVTLVLVVIILAILGTFIGTGFLCVYLKHRRKPSEPRSARYTLAEEV